MGGIVMKPFNLEEAKAGKPVCTSEGRPVRIICFDRLSNGKEYILSLVKEGDSEFLISTDMEGITISNLYRRDNLMMAGEKKHGWINIYEGGITSCIYPTEEQALLNVDTEGYSATIKIEWQE